VKEDTVADRRIPPAGDPFYAAGRRTEAELVEAIAEEEAKQGRSLTPSERVAFAYDFHAPSYRSELRRLMDLGVECPEEDES
jgi:hypothetical protein